MPARPGVFEQAALRAGSDGATPAGGRAGQGGAGRATWSGTAPCAASPGAGWLESAATVRPPPPLPRRWPLSGPQRANHVQVMWSVMGAGEAAMAGVRGNEVSGMQSRGGSAKMPSEGGDIARQMANGAGCRVYWMLFLGRFLNFSCPDSFTVLELLL